MVLECLRPHRPGSWVLTEIKAEKVYSRNSKAKICTYSAKILLQKLCDQTLDSFFQLNGPGSRADTTSSSPCNLGSVTDNHWEPQRTSKSSRYLGTEFTDSSPSISEFYTLVTFFCYLLSGLLNRIQRTSLDSSNV